MANIWKVGSRWSDSGTKESCIISVFRRNNVVFVGNNERILSVKAGDYLAIADGYNIISVAKAIKDAEYVEDMTTKWSIKDEEREILGEFEDYAAGIKVKIVDFKPNDRLKYPERGSFCQISIRQKKLREKIVEKFENQGKQFSIESYTCTLLPTKKEKAILDSKTKYIIPVYQRPYSWSENELEPFINDIFKGFWGIEKNLENQEPMFIGTMQLSEKKYIDETEYEQHIIDGQQRLSTFWVLLKILNTLFLDNKKIIETLGKIQFETQVTEEQQKYLTQLFNLTGIVDNGNEQNPYLCNASIIKNLFQNNIENCTDFPIDDFVDYLTTKIYFVVIETYAGLSKTLQIFNAINTTGLDLNGGDIFKIRMYEYLTYEKHEESTETFDKLTKIYNLIDEKNKKSGKIVVDIHGILEIYQSYLIAKYGLTLVLFDYGVDTFFDRLFDSLLNINQWEHFKNVKEQKKVELNLEELTNIIEMRYEWENEWKNSEHPEIIFSLYFIWYSRYGKYWKIVFTLLFIQKKLSKQERYQNCERLLISLSKLFFIYSVMFDKAVNEIHTFMRNLKNQIVSDTFNNLITCVEEKISSDYKKNRVIEKLNNNIAYNAKKKRLICQLSALFDEKENNVNIWEIEEKLFGTGFDIEHIHANGDDTIEVDDDLQNGIGNLVLLESEINRSIQDKSFEVKRKEYKKSEYYSTDYIVSKEKWTEEEIMERRDNEVNKIVKHLFG